MSSKQDGFASLAFVTVIVFVFSLGALTVSQFVYTSSLQRSVQSAAATLEATAESGVSLLEVSLSRRMGEPPPDPDRHCARSLRISLDGTNPNGTTWEAVADFDPATESYFITSTARDGGAEAVVKKRIKLQDISRHSIFLRSVVGTDGISSNVPTLVLSGRPGSNPTSIISGDRDIHIQGNLVLDPGAGRVANVNSWTPAASGESVGGPTYNTNASISASPEQALQDFGLILQARRFLITGAISYPSAPAAGLPWHYNISRSAYWNSRAGQMWNWLPEEKLENLGLIQSECPYDPDYPENGTYPCMIQQTRSLGIGAQNQSSNIAAYMMLKRYFDSLDLGAFNIGTRAPVYSTKLTAKAVLLSDPAKAQNLLQAIRLGQPELVDVQEINRSVYPFALVGRTKPKPALASDPDSGDFFLADDPQFGMSYSTLEPWCGDSGLNFLDPVTLRCRQARAFGNTKADIIETASQNRWTRTIEAANCLGVDRGAGNVIMCSNSLHFPNGFSAWRQQSDVAGALITNEEKISTVATTPVITPDVVAALKEDADLCGVNIDTLPDLPSYVDCSVGEQATLNALAQHRDISQPDTPLPSRDPSTYPSLSEDAACRTIKKVDLHTILGPKIDANSVVLRDHHFRRVIYSSTPIEITQSHRKGLMETWPEEIRQKMNLWIVSPSGFVVLRGFQGDKSIGTNSVKSVVFNKDVDSGNVGYSPTSSLRMILLSRSQAHLVSEQYIPLSPTLMNEYYATEATVSYSNNESFGTYTRTFAVREKVPFMLQHQRWENDAYLYGNRRFELANIATIFAAGGGAFMSSIGTAGTGGDGTQTIQPPLNNPLSPSTEGGQFILKGFWSSPRTIAECNLVDRQYDPMSNRGPILVPPNGSTLSRSQFIHRLTNGAGGAVAHLPPESSRFYSRFNGEAFMPKDFLPDVFGRQQASMPTENIGETRLMMNGALYALPWYKEDTSRTGSLNTVPIGSEFLFFGGGAANLDRRYRLASRTQIEGQISSTTHTLHDCGTYSNGRPESAVYNAGVYRFEFSGSPSSFTSLGPLGWRIAPATTRRSAASQQ